MTFLIDGYNLMHFLGLVRPRGTRSLEKSRLDLQQWLHRTHGPKVGDVSVIYDGRVSPRPDHIQEDRGLRIQFSTGQAADDLIEELIRRQTHPQRLTVVSSDRRIQEAARRRGCVAWSCSDYLDWVLDQGHEPPKPAPAPEKPAAATAEETEHWLKEFAELENDPELRRFNKMYDDFRKS